MEQSQSDHHGPLQSQSGPSQPVLAVPCLSPGMGSGSMLAWICWDEFVNLKSPFTVRWMEKCNEAHIAALRIMMRSTLSQAVASREHNIQPGSPEAGHLMSALLMAAMSKLAARRLTTPGVLENAEDTVTKLMRGLFGNLLTIAGSGVRPLSMVWQLFGVEPNFDLPTSDVEWIWYETVVALYPYTGWPLKQFHENLAKLLDKAIIRVVTKNEKVAEIKMNRTLGWLEYCQLRNIQLEHSRTIITILMRMLTTENINVAAVAARLLEQLPQILYRQTQSYTDMIKYLDHLARGGQRRGRDDLTASSVFTKRSAAFAELKANVSEACERRDWVKVKESCQALLDKHAEIAALWKVKPGVLKIQNMKAYKDLLNTNFGDDIDQDTKIRTQKIVQKVLNDAEKKRVPWQIGNEGEYGNNIEPLNEAFLHHILSGEKSDFLATSNSHRKLETSTPIIEQKPGDGFSQFGSSLKSAFVSKMEQNLSAEEVCGIIKVPVTAMRVFAKALNLEFVWDDLGGGFKAVILDLLKDRSGRAESCPTRKLFELGSGKGMMHIER